MLPSLLIEIIVLLFMLMDPRSVEKIINTEIGSIDSGLFTNIGESGFGDYMGTYQFKILSQEYGNDAPILKNEVDIGAIGESKVYSQQMDLDNWDSYVPFVLDDGNILVSNGVLWFS